MFLSPPSLTFWLTCPHTYDYILLRGSDVVNLQCNLCNRRWCEHLAAAKINLTSTTLCERCRDETRALQCFALYAMKGATVVSTPLLAAGVFVPVTRSLRLAVLIVRQRCERTGEQWRFVFKCRTWSATWQSRRSLCWVGKVSLFASLYCMWTTGEALECDSDVYIQYDTNNLELLKNRWNQITD